MQRVSGTPVETVLILEGLILLFLLMSDVVAARLRARTARTTGKAALT
jgi:simple sugar transport system permease protein